MSYYRKRKTYKKRKPNSRWKVYGKAGEQLFKDVMYLKSIINSEPKNFDKTFSGTFNYNGSIYAFSNMAQGDGADTRDGNRILPRYLTVRGHINRELSAPVTEHTTIRLILFRWWGESPNAVGAAPVPSDILKTVGGASAPLQNLNDNITGSKGDRNRRIEVHRSDFFTLDSVSRTSYDFEYKVELNGAGKKVKEHMEYFDATTAQPTDGGFFMLAIANHATSADQVLTGYSRLVYYDN